MSQTTPLSAAYQHPGFVPEPLARIEDDDPDTFILPLRRRQKKTSAAGAVTRAAPTITSAVGVWSSTFKACGRFVA